MIKVAFFDVDGTLLSHKTGQIPDSTIKALKELRNIGVKVVLSTGRHLSELDELPFQNITFDGYVMVNGQLCLNEKKEIIYDNPIEGEAKEKIIQLFQDKEIPIVLVEENRMYINYVDDYVIKSQQEISTSIPKIDKYKSDNLYLACAYINKTQEDTLKKLLFDCTITRWNDNAIDIVPKNISKVTGIKQYLQANNINKNETMAFGDGPNDIEMLKYVEIGVAMGNGKDEVKEIADYVTDDIDSDGIYKALIDLSIL